MKKVAFSTDFLKGLTFAQMEDIMIRYRDICQQKERYYHYEGNNDWDLRQVRKGQIMLFTVRNNDEVSFNNNKYFVDNDVAMVMLRKHEYDFVIPSGFKGEPVPSMAEVFETARMIMNLEPAVDARGKGHIRASLMVGVHQLRSHAPGGKTTREFIWHEDGWGKGKLRSKELDRLNVCQRTDEPAFVVRTDGKANVLSEEECVGCGFNFHEVYSNSSNGCGTIPRVNGTDDRYMWNYRPYLLKATVRDRAVVCVIGCDTLMKICDDLKIDYTSTCQITNL